VGYLVVSSLFMGYSWAQVTAWPVDKNSRYISTFAFRRGTPGLKK
jgi:hypothetical protein